MDTSRASKYFFGAQLSGWGLLGSGVLLTLTGMGAIVGLPLIGYWAWQNKDSFGRPSDEEYDAAVRAKVGDVKARALAKLGMDESELNMIEPIWFWGPSPKAPDGKGSHIKKGKDGEYRTSSYNAVAVFFSENQVFIYQRIWSMVNDNQKETVEEYFYKDVVSVSTASESTSFTEMQGKKEVSTTVNFEEFRLRTTGGDAAQAGVDRKAAPEIERQIQGMKNLVRDKKMSQ